jgi:acyl-CoA thioesterase FadM
VALTRVGGKSLTFAVEFRKGGAVIARGQITTCCCLVGTPEGIRAIDLPADIRQKLEAAA